MKIVTYLFMSLLLLFVPCDSFAGTGYSPLFTLDTRDTAATIRLAGDLAFGNVTVGQSVSRTLSICNDGNSARNVSSINYPASFSGAWSGSIAAGSLQNVSVVFNPPSALAYGGTITVSSDATSGGNTISCSGTGVAWSISPFSASYPASGGSSSVVVVTLVSCSSCDWSATKDAAWITFTGSTSGSANGSVPYSVANNSGTSRTGHVFVAGLTHTITQARGGGTEETIFNNFNGGGVQNNPSQPTTFTISQSYQITYIETYHYFNGGALPGTIGLQRSGGSLYGPWQASGVPAGAVQNAYWTIAPNQVIPAGTYQVMDSGPSTWSQNSQSGNRGLCKVRGIPQGGGGLWAGATDLGGGWKWQNWFGYFADPGAGWIYHMEHQWMYCIGDQTASIWFWTADLGWLWSGNTVYPFLYRDTPAAWLWYLSGGSAPNRWFLNMNTGVWEEH